jgi:hypothetical protein
MSTPRLRVKRYPVTPSPSIHRGADATTTPTAASRSMLLAAAAVVAVVCAPAFDASVARALDRLPDHAAARHAVRCQRDILRAGGTFFDTKLALLGACADASFRCREVDDCRKEASACDALVAELKEDGTETRNDTGTAEVSCARDEDCSEDRLPTGVDPASTTGVCATDTYFGLQGRCTRFSAAEARFADAIRTSADCRALTVEQLREVAGLGFSLLRRNDGRPIPAPTPFQGATGERFRRDVIREIVVGHSRAAGQTFLSEFPLATELGLAKSVCDAFTPACGTVKDTNGDGFSPCVLAGILRGQDRVVFPEPNDRAQLCQPAGDQTSQPDVAQCEKTIHTAFTRLSSKAYRSLSACAVKLMTCEQTSTNRSCAEHAVETCLRSRSTLERARLAAGSAISKRCGDIDFARLRQRTGLDLGLLGKPGPATPAGTDGASNVTCECSAVGIDPLDSLDDYTRCADRSHECRLANLVNAAAPRLSDLLSAQGLTTNDIVCNALAPSAPPTSDLDRPRRFEDFIQLPDLEAQPPILGITNFDGLCKTGRCRVADRFCTGDVDGRRGSPCDRQEDCVDKAAGVRVEVTLAVDQPVAATDLALRYPSAIFLPGLDDVSDRVEFAGADGDAFDFDSDGDGSEDTVELSAFRFEPLAGAVAKLAFVLPCGVLDAQNETGDVTADTHCSVTVSASGAGRTCADAGPPRCGPLAFGCCAADGATVCREDPTVCVRDGDCGPGRHCLTVCEPSPATGVQTTGACTSDAECAAAGPGACAVKDSTTGQTRAVPGIFGSPTFFCGASDQCNFGRCVNGRCSESVFSDVTCVDDAECQGTCARGTCADSGALCDPAALPCDGADTCRTARCGSISSTNAASSNAPCNTAPDDRCENGRCRLSASACASDRDCLYSGACGLSFETCQVCDEASSADADQCNPGGSCRVTFDDLGTPKTPDSVFEDSATTCTDERTCGSDFVSPFEVVDAQCVALDRNTACVRGDKSRGQCSTNAECNLGILEPA